MRKVVLAATAIVAVSLAVPASAQVGAGVGPGGAGVQVGPFGAGVGPGYGGGRGYRSYGYAGDCRVIRERTMTPSGRRIIRTRRVCY